MKRLRPDERKIIIRNTVDKLQNLWLCSYSDWNRDKLTKELIHALREVVKERKSIY